MTTHPIRVALVLAVALLATACSGREATTVPAVTPVPVPTVEPPASATGTTSPTPSPTATPTDPTPTAEETEDAATLTYFLVRAGGERLFVEPVPFTYDPDEVGGAVARRALTELLAAEPADGLVQPVPAGTQLRGVNVVDRVLLIDLSEDVTTNPGSGGAGEEAFAQALAHTGAQFPTVDAVQLLVEGQAVSELWGHLDWSQPIAPDEFAIVPIDIVHASGSDGSIELAGTANVFEAVFHIELHDADGNVVDSAFVMADCGTGCRGEWTHAFPDRGPGTWTVLAREDDPSGGEGFAPFEVQTTVTTSG
ncbi:MAG TPA: GerMN domain-containing protein [Euzebya sp.]|nr:GerMN domain-containing protein [Euzebya sp.]